MKTKLFKFHLKKGWSDLEAAKQLDSNQTLVLAFFSSAVRDNEEAFKELTDSFSMSTVVGCSTSGEIFEDHVEDDSICCLAMKFTYGKFEHHSVAIDNPKDSFKVGAELSNKFIPEGLAGLLVLSDGLLTNGSELIKGINSNINPSKTPVAGGLAGDGNAFEKTFVFHDKRVYEKSVVAIGFYGSQFSISNGSRGGWDIFGPKRRITKSVGNVLYEIDNQPALKLYKEYLGDKARDLPSSGLFFPLEVTMPDGGAKLVRTILGVDEESQSLTFAGDVPKGAEIQLMRANFDSLINVAGEACEQAQVESQSEREGDAVIIAISCVGRRLVLGAKTDDEIESVQESSNGASIIGFYSYGELSPSAKDNPCELHNQSMTIMKIVEKNGVG